MSSYGMMPNTDMVRPAATPGVDAPMPLDQPKEVTPGQGAGESFGNVLGKFVSDVNTKQNVAMEAVDGLQSGQGVPLHQAVIAMEEANVSFQLMVEVRNKLLDSYQELMRMQV
jgi:flagellar hook-basal body complex protein FliE